MNSILIHLFSAVPLEVSISSSCGEIEKEGVTTVQNSNHFKNIGCVSRTHFEASVENLTSGLLFSETLEELHVLGGGGGGGWQWPGRHKYIYAFK